MPAPSLMISLGVVLCFSLSTRLHLWQLASVQLESQPDGFLEILLGESRQMFANHFFVKSDVYFHSGYYPTIFDETGAKHSLHIAEDAGARPESTSGAETNKLQTTGKKESNQPHEEEHDFLGPPKDWIDAFGRNAFPTAHTHLDEQTNGVEREILPWIKISARLDPHRVETYTTAAYWLRQRLGRAKEAVSFLRDGWRENPDSYEIIFELGRVFAENEKDFNRARNLWEYALRKWHEKEDGKPEQNLYVYEQIVGHLAKLEEDTSNYPQALKYLELMKKASHNPAALEKEIEEIRQKAGQAKPN